MSGFGDIHDVLVTLPHGDPHGGTAYVTSDLFTVRHELIRQLEPAPTSVFEFGALYGYFLVTALDAAPSIERVGWVDDESHTPESNRMCMDNVWSVRSPTDHATALSIVYFTSRGDFHAPGQFDLVSVDSDHSYDGCLADLHAAHTLNPRWIFVDDWTADTHAQDILLAVEDFQLATRHAYQLTEHVTVNGLAVLTRKEHA